MTGISHQTRAVGSCLSETRSPKQIPDRICSWAREGRMDRFRRFARVGCGIHARNRRSDVVPKAPILLILLSFLLSSARVAAGGGGAEAGTRWLVIQPGYPGSTQDAEGFMRSFSEYLQGKTGLASLRGTYHNVPEKALAAIETHRPAFSLVSLGFFLEHRRRLGLAAVLESKPEDRFVIVALEGAVKGPEALRGATVAGGPLYEKSFLERVVFRGRAPVASWKGEPGLRSTRALRRLERGRYRAVVLTGREYAALEALSRRKKLEKVLESAYYPQTLLVHHRSRPPGEEKALGEDSNEGRRAAQKRSTITREKGTVTEGARSRAKPAEARRLSEEKRLALKAAFLALGQDAAGRALLKTMGTRGFGEVRSEWLKRMEGMYDAEEEK